MNKQNMIVFLLLALGLGGIITVKRIMNKKQTKWRIGILQTATHPALDAVREGFIQQIKHELGNDVQIITQNAEGSINSMQAMAQSLHTQQDIDLFFAIATPAAQSLALLEKERPIIFAAVTDPHAAGIIKPTSKNTCGTIDMIDAGKQVELLRTLVPSAKTIGLLFNKGEINSQSLAQQLRIALEKEGLQTIEFGVTNEAEVPAAIEVACRKADAIITPIDNTVACTIEIIAATARNMQIPLLVSDNLLVAQGALAAQGVDYAQSGKNAAQLAQQILQEHRLPYELPIVTPDCKTVLNKKELDRLHIQLPEALQNVELINKEG